MIFLGYNFLLDGNALDPTPTDIVGINNVEITNGIFDEVDISRDHTSPYNTQKAGEWTLDSILQATFNGNLNGGNVAATLDTLNAIRIKRRKVGEFDWILIREVAVNSVDDINFTFADFTNANNIEYEYAWIPVLNGAEGDYTIVSVYSKFRGVFIADIDSIHKMYARVSYGQTQRAQQIGVFTPLNRKYPVYISNGALNYEGGSISALIVGDYEQTGRLDRGSMVREKDSLLDFLTNKKAKILKDENGNIWLVCIIGNPSVGYEPNWGNGMMTIGAEWSEVGDLDSQKDRAAAGFVPIETN